MGICIYYKGHLDDMSKLPDLVQAVERACKGLGWPTWRVDERILGTAKHLVWRPYEEGKTFLGMKGQWDFEGQPVDDRWRGIIVAPPRCETVWITFDRSGQLMAYDATPSDYKKPGSYWARYNLFTKTQFGTPGAHIDICRLLRLVEAHGVTLEVSDESGYWESGNRAQLEQSQALIDHFMNLLVDSLEGQEGVEVEKGRSIEKPLPDWRRDWGQSAGEN